MRRPHREHYNSIGEYQEAMKQYYAKGEDKTQPEDTCQCDECKELYLEEHKIHLSDCIAHNEPAEPKGKCDCKPLSI